MRCSSSSSSRSSSRGGGGGGGGGGSGGGGGVGDDDGAHYRAVGRDAFHEFFGAALGLDDEASYPHPLGAPRSVHVRLSILARRPLGTRRRGAIARAPSDQAPDVTRGDAPVILAQPGRTSL